MSNMKNFKTIILLVIIALPFVILILYLTSWSQSGTGEPTSPIVFPDSGNVGINKEESLTIVTSTGATFSVRNFLSDSETVKDDSNEGFYYLGNHFPVEESASAASPEYVIGYIEKTDFFNIGLFREPIAESRRSAEQFLMASLGVAEEQMCQLDYTVSVPHWVNEFYAGKNLKFSFCPGAVQLE